MKNGFLNTLIASFLFIIYFQSMALAVIDVEMILNDAAFVSFDHFKAELYLNNPDAMVPDAWIFGIIEVCGEFYYWPDYGVEVNFQTMSIESGVTFLTFLEIDFPNVDNVIPFGPMSFWGAWKCAGMVLGWLSL